MKSRKPLIVILGPTACGKTRLAVELAAQTDGEIISADSRQVYRGMDIGTGKDYEAYNHPLVGRVRHHLIDIVAAGDDYHVARFQQDFRQAYQDIMAWNQLPIMCGGTGMYIEAVLKNYKHTQVPIDDNLRDELEHLELTSLKELFETEYSGLYPEADVSTRKRLIRAIEVGRHLSQNPASVDEQEDYNTLVFGISIPAEVRRERITLRLHQRLAEGMVEEVQGLLQAGVAPEKLIFYGLEYKFITEYLTGQLAYDAMVKKLEVAIHQFAKRQMTFFRSMEKKGINIHWLDGLEDIAHLTAQILHIIENVEQDSEASN